MDTEVESRYRIKPPAAVNSLGKSVAITKLICTVAANKPVERNADIGIVDVKAGYITVLNFWRLKDATNAVKQRIVVNVEVMITKLWRSCSLTPLSISSTTS